MTSVREKQTAPSILGVMSEGQKHALKLVVAAAFYWIVGFILYRWQLEIGPAFVNVFLLFNYSAPVVLLLVNARIIGTAFPTRWNRRATIVTAVALAVVLTVLEFFALLIFILNTF